VKVLFISGSLTVHLCLLEYVWLTTDYYFPSVHRLHHYTALTLIIFHSILLIISAYVREWLEKIDFVWLKQIDHERRAMHRQRDELIKQVSSFLPMRVINYYLRADSDLAASQHYQHKYDRMAMLHISFHLPSTEQQPLLYDYLHDIDYMLKTNEKYAHIVMHRKSTIKELVLSIDVTQSESIKYLQQLIELLFHLDERIKQISSGTITIAACLHVGTVQEILIHAEKNLKIDFWSDDVALLQMLMTKTQPNHCLTTASVYHLLHDLYLFRTAGSIVSAPLNGTNNINIYYLLGRLIGDNVFQVENFVRA
jgi:hypothetical protein